MQNLPEYQESAAVQPVQFVSMQSAQDDIQKRISGFVDKFSNFAAGQERALKSEALKQQEEAKQAEREQAIVIVSQNYDRLKQEQLNNPDQLSVAKFDAKSDGFNSGFITNISKANQGYVQDLMSAHQISGRDEISGVVRAQGKNIQEENFIESYGEQRKQLQLLAQSGALAIGVNGKPQINPDTGQPITAAEVMEKQMVSSARSFVANGGSGSLGGNLINSIKDDRTQAEAIGQITRKLQTGDANGAKEIEKNIIADPKITPDQKRSIEIEASRLHSIFKIGTDISKASARDNMEGAIEQVSNGNWNINDPRFAQARAGMLDAGEDVGDFDNRARAASLSSQYTKAIREASPDQQREIASKFDASPNDSAQDVKIKEYARANIDKIISSSNALTKSDPVAEYNKTQVSQGVKTIASTMPANQDGQTRFNVIDGRMAWQNAKNIPVEEQKPLSNDEARQISTNISSAQSIPDKLNIINSAIQGVGKYQPQLLKQLKKVGVPEEVFALTNLDKIPQSAPYINELMATFNSKRAIIDQMKAKDKSAQSDIKNKVTDTLGDFLNTIPNTPDGINYKNDVVETVSMASLGHVYQTGADKDKAVELMAKTLYGNRFSMINGKIRVPYDVDADIAMKAVKASNDEIQNTKYSQKSEKLNTLAGHWESYGDNSGVYWVDNKDTPTGSKVKWSDLNDPTSEISKLMVKHKPSGLHRWLSFPTRGNE